MFSLSTRFIIDYCVIIHQFT